MEDVERREKISVVITLPFPQYANKAVVMIKT
jgi:hypothetical protein